MFFFFFWGLENTVVFPGSAAVGVVTFVVQNLVFEIFNKDFSFTKIIRSF